MQNRDLQLAQEQEDHQAALGAPKVLQQVPQAPAS